MKKTFTIGVFGIIFNRKKEVLLCHRRDKDIWNLPGGGLEPGEFITDALTREVKEETGLEVKIVKLVGVYDKVQERDVVFSFVCKVVSGKILLNSEADVIEYFPFDDLPLNIAPKHLRRIKDALNHKKAVIIAKQI